MNEVPLYITHGNKCHKVEMNEVGVLESQEIQELYADHEEADTRLLLHANHAATNHQHVVVRSPDTDVFILLTSHKSSIPSSLLFDTGTGNQRRVISIDNVVDTLGSDLSKALIGFHAFTGCDTTSAFYGKGKAKPFSILEKYPEFVEMFQTLGTEFQVSETLLGKIEKFVCRLYNQTNTAKVNKARYDIFKIGQFNEDSMPCTLDALEKHTNRSAYQASIWKRALVPIISPPPFTEHGWVIEDGIMKVKWMSLPPAPESILENANCSCKSGCKTKRCSCLKAELKCTTLCSCIGCTNATHEYNAGSLDEDKSASEDDEDDSDLSVDEDGI